jgi:hypothetical protein
VSGLPEASLWTRDGLGAADTVLARTEQKGQLGRAAENENLSGTPQVSLGAAFRDAAEDVLIFLNSFLIIIILN